MQTQQSVPLSDVVPRPKKSFFLLIALISTLVLLATDIYTPAMPAVGEYFHVNNQAVQLTITLFLVSFSLSQLVYGSLSDHFGRRPFILLGLLIYLLGTLLCAIATHIELLYFGRFLQGAGAGAIASLNRVMVNELFSGIELVKIMSYLAAIVCMTPAFAPVLGGIIQTHLSWRWIFLLLLAYAVIATV